MSELLCSVHGPYDSALGGCPYCTAGRPQAPAPLSDFDAPTDLGFGQPAYSNKPSHVAPSWSSEAPTDLGDVSARSPKREEPVSDATELDYTPTGLMGILWVKSGPRRGNIYKIQNGIVVGRKSGGVALDDPKVSNPHAKFTLENDQFIIWDFGSANGTYVNGEKIRGAAELKENDEIKIGDNVFALKILQ